MANSASDARATEADIRRQLIEERSVDVMIAIGSNFFYTVTLPVTLWFLDRGKRGTPREDTCSSWTHATCTGRSTARTADFLPEQVELLANTVRLYRGEEPESVAGSERAHGRAFPDGVYADVRPLQGRGHRRDRDPGLEPQSWPLCRVAAEREDERDFHERLAELHDHSRQCRWRLRRYAAASMLRCRRSRSVSAELLLGRYLTP